MTTLTDLKSAVIDIENHFRRAATNDVITINSEYEDCRNILLTAFHTEPWCMNSSFTDNLPKLVHDFPSLAEYWQWIKYEFGTYAERRAFLFEQFKPLKQYLETLAFKQLTTPIIKPEISISNDYINSAINKANGRIESRDYDGAITIARTLMEEMQSEIIRKMTGNEPDDYKGDLIKLWRKTATLLSLATDRDLDDRLKKIISGLYNINEGIAGLRNIAGDAHAKKFSIAPHHAKLAVNSAFIFCQFLCDTYLYQQAK
ncbi:MAG: abortive infection family protein [Proteobacteria bacterium]|nr:abortive infection family protein [Pseudomonadota bacterium]